MKQVLSLMLGVFLILTVSSAQTDSLSEAAEAYQNGSYLRAIELYEASIEQGIYNADIFFNLGNAYYQNFDMGRALLNYRRAQLFIPRDENLNYNIALVRAQRSNIQGDETDLIHNLGELTSNILTLTELSVLVFILWLVWFGLLLAYLLRQQWRFTLLIPLLTVGMVLLISLIPLAARLYTETNRPSAVVIEPVSMMSGPGEDYLEYGTLYPAAEIRLIEQRDGWARFALPDGQQGWAKLDTVATIALPN